MAVQKTNVMRILDKNKINYEVITYDISDDKIDGISVAEKTGQDMKEVYKTLVTQGVSRELYVFVIPVDKELDLKKAAKSVNEKSIEMLKSANLLSLTGYIHGGCSPIGMKKQFKTIIDISSSNKDKIFISGGKIGYQIEIELNDLRKVIDFELQDITKED